MDNKYLDNFIQKIQVRNVLNADVEVVNNSPLMMIGKGRQGAVFQVSDDICVKVFGNKEDCEREYYALSLGQQTDLFPRVYAKGPLYIAMDIIKGVDLREYLQSQPLTQELSIKLINMLITFKDIGFDRIDHHKRQIFLQPNGNLKVIDVARTVWRDRVYPYPRKLLTSLGEEYKELFLSHVQVLAPQLYEEWKHYIQMEEISRQLYQILITESPKTDTLMVLSQRLLTTNDEQKYVVQLEGLVSKVFKEEWVKTMLAQGHDVDSVMKKIDKYWESRENGNDPKNDKHRENGRFPGKDRHRENGRFPGKDRHRENGRFSEKDKYRENSRLSEKDRHRENGGFFERDRYRENGRPSERDRYHEKDRPSAKDKYSEKNRDHERNKPKDKGKKHR